MNKEDAEQATFALWWAGLVVEGTFFILQTYLTQVWKLSFTGAATFLNIWGGIYRILSIFFLFLADTLLGNYLTLLLSAIFSVTGLVVITVTTSVGYKCHKKGEAECVGHAEKALFIMGMILIALGKAALFACIEPFINDQFNNNNGRNNVVDQTNNNDADDQTNNDDDDQTNNNNCEINNVDNQTNNNNDQINNVDNHTIEAVNMESDRPSFGSQICQVMIWIIHIVHVICAIPFIVMPVVAFFAFPYVKKWYILFGVSAFCTVFATVVFIGENSVNFGRKSVMGPKAEGSPITDFFRVFVAAAFNISQPSIKPNDQRLYVSEDGEFKELSTSRVLGFLDKAAIKVDDDTSVEKRSWRVCSVSEVESTKIMIRIMASAYITYMLSGVVFSIGNTYFVEQATHMKYTIRGWKPPLQAILLIFMACKFAVGFCYYGVCIVRGQDLAHKAGATGAMFSIICCTVAAAVERRRLHVVRRHGLLDLPDDSEVPMSAFWLLFQVIFLGVVGEFLTKGLSDFHECEAPESMKRYSHCLGEGVKGVGFMCGALSVYVVGKISEIGESKNWFQHTLNRSRLDRYYWVLAVLSSLNFILCITGSFSYRRKGVAGGTAQGAEQSSKPETENKKKKKKRARRKIVAQYRIY